MRTSLCLALALGLLGCRNESPAAPTSPAPVIPAVPAVPAAPSAPTADQAVPAPGTIDPCVLGEWRLTPENAKRVYAEILGRTGAPVNVATVSGSATLSMNAAGNATSNLSGMTVGYSIQDPNAAMIEMSVILDGTTSARFSAQAGNLAFSDSTSHIRGRMHVKVRGHEQEVPFDSSLGDMFGATQSGTARYRCEGGNLIVSNPAMPGVETVYVR